MFPRLWLVQTGLIVLLFAAATTASKADDLGAIASGNWSDAFTWTQNKVPVYGDVAYIGTSNVSGAATSATVTLTGNQSALEVRIGFGAGTSGTLQLGDFTLTADRLKVGGGGAASVVRGMGFLQIADTITVDSPNSFVFAANDRSSSLIANNNSNVTTAVTANLTDTVQVNSGSILTLGANLTTNSVFISGATINAQGNRITGNGGISLNGGTILNRGGITTGDLAVSNQSFNLSAADSVSQFRLTNASTAFAVDAAVSQLTLNGSTGTTSDIRNITTSFAINSGSSLTLGAAAQVTGLSSVEIGGVLNAQGHAITAGELQLGGTLQNRGGITASTLDIGIVNSTSGGQAFALASTDTVTTLRAYGGSILSFGTSSGVSSLEVRNGAIATTSGEGNVSGSASVIGAGSKLTLGTNLQLSSSLSVTGGVVDAQGHDISASSLTLRAISGTAPGFQNMGAITAVSYDQGGMSSLTLGAGDSTITSLLIQEASTLTSIYAAGNVGRLTLSGTSSNALTIESGSHLALNLNGNQQGYAFRWANPNGGDHISELTSLITSGGITFNLSNGASYALSTDSLYTYILQPTPEPAACLVVAAAGLLVIRRRAAKKNLASTDINT